MEKNIKKCALPKRDSSKKEPLAVVHCSELPDTFALRDYASHFLFFRDGATVTSTF